ncbi:MAG: methyltransferase [Bacteroidota bacterium]
MGASTFRFQQFTIAQDRCAMKVSTDGILLGAWAAKIEAKQVLDIGTGTGLLALMYAQSNPNVQIDAIEIDPAAAEQARANFEASRFAERLSLSQESLQDYRPDTRYDLFVCNPPYFRAGITPPENARAQARHDQSLDFETLVKHSKRLASPQALLAMILPTDRYPQIINNLAKQNWLLHQCMFIQANPHKAAKRVLLLAGREDASLKEDLLTIRDEQGRYTSQYQQLTRSYYLPFAFE